MAISIHIGTTTADYSSHAGRIGRLAPQGARGLLCWHKTRCLPPKIYDPLTSGNSTVGFRHFPGGFVSPMRVALSARVSTHDQHTLALQIDAMRTFATRRG
jgi:hypothetical protein